MEPWEPDGVRGVRRVLGQQGPHTGLEFQWSDDAASRLIALQAGTVDGIDNPGTADIATIKADSNLQFQERPGLNVSFLGMNNSFEPWDDEKVRQAIAMGINRQQIVDNFYPEGSTVADYFTPCEIPFACEGDKNWGFDPEAAKQLLADAGFPNGFDTKIHFRAAVRGYVTDPPLIATEISQQLKANLNVNAEPELLESGAMIDGFAAGTLPGLTMIGWGADYPDPSNFLDYHFGSGSGTKFGTPFPDIVEALNEGVSTADPAARTAAYTTANNLIKQHAPATFLVHGASGAAFKADIENAYASVFGAERFETMKAADRDTFVWMQNAEPLGLYCADETDGESLRACEMVNESLYAYEVGGAEAIPALATECTASADLDDLDVHAARRCHVPRRSRLSTPTTSSSATPPSGTRSTRCTRAAPVRSSTSPASGEASSTRRRRPPERSSSDRATPRGAAIGGAPSLPARVIERMIWVP